MKWRAVAIAGLLASSVAARAQDTAPLAPAAEPTAPAQPGGVKPNAPAQQVYGPEFFARFSPRTASDMLVQVPGFTIRGTDDARGLGQASSNVVINGQRMSGKSEDALTQLSRIAAGNVLRIEIVDAATLNLPGLSGQVANVVVRNVGLTGQYSWRGEVRPHYADPLWSRFDVSISGTRGPVEYTLGVSNNANRGAAGGPSRISAGDGALIETRRSVLTSNYDNPKATAAFKLDGPGSSVGNLNLSYHRVYGLNRLDETRQGPGLPDRQRLSITRERGFDYEIGGDYEFRLGPGRLKLIGLDRFTREPFSEQDVISLSDGTDATGGRYVQTADSREKIARGEYSWKLWGADWQLSGEAAFNRLDNVAGLFTLDPSGAFVELPFPDGTGGVRESRYEAILTYGRPLTRKLSLQLTGGAEVSRLSQTGANALSRRFLRPKGSLLLAWVPHRGLDLSFKLRRRVGQLEFGDFLARVFLDDAQANAGNARLVPPQSWEAEIEAKQTLGGWGTTTLRLFNYRIEDLVDFIPIAGGGESPGNINRARRTGLESTTTVQFDRLGIKGAKLDVRVALERSRLRDPLTARSRPISETEQRVVEIDFRHDIPRTQWAWGLNVGNYHYAPYYRTSEVGLEWEGPTFAGIFVQNKDVLGLTLTARASNVINARNRFDRVVYAGPRDNAPVAFTEHRSRLIGPIFSLTAKGNF